MRFIANGLRTDHPIPGLPFVDDSLLTDPSDRFAIEAIGRGRGEGMWGREDLSFKDGKLWRAFTTIPANPELAWAVRHHDDHGAAIVLIADDDAAGFHSGDLDALIFRHGGYWTVDGLSWYRPYKKQDPLYLDSGHEQVPDVQTITAHNWLEEHDAVDAFSRGQRTVYSVDEIARILKHDSAANTMVTHSVPDWVKQHLSTWASHRTKRSRPSDQCIVDFQAQELEPARLVATPAVAATFGVAQSTIRGYLHRGQAPEPQFTNPPRWSLPVLDNWVDTNDRRNGILRVPSLTEEAESRLVGLAEAILTAVGPLAKRGKIKQKDYFSVSRHVANVVGEHTMGLSKGWATLPGELFGAWMIQDWHEAADNNRMAEILSDRVRDNVLLLMVTNPVAAQKAFAIFARHLIKSGKTREEIVHYLTHQPGFLEKACTEFITEALTSK